MQNLPSTTSERITAIQTCRYFHGIDPHIITDLAENTRLVRFDPGEMIFWEGEDCSGLYIIRQGMVKLYKASPQGRLMVINTLGETESFNEVPVFDLGTNPVNVAALTSCELWIVSCETIRTAIAGHPAMAHSIITNLSQNLRMLIGLVEELSFYQVTNRLARLILNLPQNELSGQGEQRLTQDELASRLGTVREVVARSLKQLERSGAIQVSRRQITIQDSALLKEWAQLP